MYHSFLLLPLFFFTWANVERLHTVENRFSILQDAVLAHHGERSKRAIFNGIGSGMKWLFGVATTEQFTKSDGKLKKLTKESASMTHLIRHQATLINESLGREKRVK